MSALKNAVLVIACGAFVYNVVDDKTRAKFDNGAERQKIQIVEIKHSAYQFIWEMLGAHEDELARAESKFAAEMKIRKEALDKRIQEVEGARAPAEDDSKKYEKYMTK